MTTQILTDDGFPLNPTGDELRDVIRRVGSLGTNHSDARQECALAGWRAGATAAAKYLCKPKAEAEAFPISRECTCVADDMPFGRCCKAQPVNTSQERTQETLTDEQFVSRRGDGSIDEGKTFDAWWLRNVDVLRSKTRPKGSVAWEAWSARARMQSSLPPVETMLTREQCTAITECIDYLAPAAEDFAEIGMGESKHGRCIRTLRALLAAQQPKQEG